jgi:membrane associated rhomboid family serine protease
MRHASISPISSRARQGRTMLFPFDDDTPTVRFPLVTVTIIALNVLVFIYTATMTPQAYREFVARFGFVPARLRQLTNPNLVIPVPIGTQRERVRQGNRIIEGERPIMINLPANRRSILRTLVSSLFLHGGLEHIVGNMWFFWIFGNNIEDRLGRIRFLAFYLGAGVFASLCHSVIPPGVGSNIPVIGASGAVAGTLGAYAVLYPHARVRSLVFLFLFFTVVELPALVVLGAWFLLQLLQAVSATKAFDMSGGVALWAHVGGFVLGAVLIHFIARPEGYFGEAREELVD